ncbi:MAG: META domain-containing protein [Chitinophagaceae bacterium]|nr:MAG: META domain-containing protein [Chitinophagaceae bacterium]
MNGNPVLGNKFAKGAPTIQLDLGKQAITGHDGCNQLSGTFEVMGDKIRFADMIQTEMACPSNPSAFNFGSLISGETISYFFKDGLLHFYLKDDSILIFAKT